MIPAGVPPHRAAPIASPAQRLEMTRLACAEFPGLVADGREVERAGPSYTVDTLESLHEQDRGRPLALLLGVDAFMGLAGWHRWERLFTLAHLVVVERPGTAFDPDALAPQLRAQWERRIGHRPVAAVAAARRRDRPGTRRAAADFGKRHTRRAGAGRRRTRARSLVCFHPPF